MTEHQVVTRERRQAARREWLERERKYAERVRVKHHDEYHDAA